MQQEALFDIQETPGASLVPAGTVRVGHPAWLPASIPGRVAAAGGRIAYTVTLSSPERKILKKRKKILVSEWAEKHRTLTMSAIPGPWRNEVTPYSVGIMDAMVFPSVRVVSVCKCPQSGITESVHNFVGSIIDQDPGPVLYTFPDQQTAEENSRDRILPMIKSSARLKSYLTQSRHDESMLRISLAHMPIYLAWASSPARLGNKPIRYAIADEVDKYPARVGRETSALELMDKRLTTYREVSRFVKISTPTVESAPITMALREAEVVFHYWARCPLCGQDQRMQFSRIKFGDCRDPREMRAKKLAVYACEHCEGHWDDNLRNRAIANGHWRAQDAGEPLGLELFAYLSIRRPQNVAFHLPAWETRFVSLSESAAAFLETLDGKIEKKKNFANQHQAKPYVDIIMAPVETAYKDAVLSGLPQQTVPESAVALTCGVDCQKSGFYFLVRAWARDYTSWLVHYGKLADWRDVEELLFATSYPVAGSGRRMAIARAAMDTGGGRFADESMTEEAYMWIRKNGVGRGARCWGVKGATWPQPNKVKMSKSFDKTPAGKPIPGGLQILTLDTEKLKDAFFWRLEQAVHAAEMAAFLHADTGDSYFAHITAEEKRVDEKGVLRWIKKGSRRNDWLDCEIYAAAAADPEWPEGGIHLMVPPGPRESRRQREPGGDSGAFGAYEMPSWMDGD